MLEIGGGAAAADDFYRWRVAPRLEQRQGMVVHHIFVGVQGAGHPPTPIRSSRSVPSSPSGAAHTDRHSRRTVVGAMLR